MATLIKCDSYSAFVFFLIDSSPFLLTHFSNHNQHCVYRYVMCLEVGHVLFLMFLQGIVILDSMMMMKILGIILAILLGRIK